MLQRMKTHAMKNLVDNKTTKHLGRMHDKNRNSQ